MILDLLGLAFLIALGLILAMVVAILAVMFIFSREDEDFNV